MSDGTTCPGQFTIEGFGKAQLTSTSTVDASSTGVHAVNTVVAGMGARVYFSQTCTNGSYNNERYSAVELVGRTFSFTTDISDAGCGCNAALYLVSMKQNSEKSECHDYYCDANKVCGVSCTEVDIMEGNKHAWHSTLHSAHDHSGLGAGLGGGTDWNGPRDWSKWDYGPGGKCIDTKQPFDVAVSFPAEDSRLKGMTVKLTQKDKDCPLSISLNKYEGMTEIQKALELGMTPVISYWKAKDMLWLDGKGSDGNGPCSTDSDHCGDSVKFYNFKLEAMPGQPPLPPTTSPPPSPSSVANILALPPILPLPQAPLATLPPVPMVPSVEMLPTVPAVPTLAPLWSLPLDRTKCSAKGMDCRQTLCCSEAGMQCYLKDQFWASCRASCVSGTVNPGDPPQYRLPWACTPLGRRTPDGQAQFGNIFSGFTVQRVVTVVVALFALVGLGVWVWRSRAESNNDINGSLMYHRRPSFGGARPTRTGLEELRQGSPGTARGRLAEQLGQSPLHRGHGQSPVPRGHGQSPLPRGHGQPQMLQRQFVGLMVQQPSASMSTWRRAPSSPQLLQSP